MPQVTVYVRAEDFDKWKTIQAKSQFMHEALSNVHLGAKRGSFVSEEPDPEYGYPCCQDTMNPCRHWVWIGEEGIWRNKLTGKTVEVM